MREVEGRARAQVDAGLAAGMQLFVSVSGEVVLDAAVGSLAQAPRPVTPDTRFCLFSASKPLTACVVHALAQRGLLSYEDPVARHIPAFAQQGKEGVTVAHLLLHQAGLMTAEAGLTPASFADWDAALAGICAAPPSSPPGAITEYHPLSAYAVLGAVAEAVTGEPFPAVFDREVARPLGMASTTWGRPPGADVTETHGADELMADALRPWNGPPGATALVPAGGAWSTARDMGRFYELLRRGGRLPDGTVLLEESLVADAVSIKALWGPGSRMGFGYGFFVGAEPAAPASRGALASPATFGHPGFCSALAQCDPDRQAVMVFLANGAPQQAESDARFAELADAVARAVDS